MGRKLPNFYNYRPKASWLQSLRTGTCQMPMSHVKQVVFLVKNAEFLVKESRSTTSCWNDLSFYLWYFQSGIVCDKIFSFLKTDRICRSPLRSPPCMWGKQSSKGAKDAHGQAPISHTNSLMTSSAAWGCTWSSHWNWTESNFVFPGQRPLRINLLD